MQKAFLKQVNILKSIFKPTPCTHDRLSLMINASVVVIMKATDSLKPFDVRSLSS